MELVFSVQSFKPRQTAVFTESNGRDVEGTRRSTADGAPPRRMGVPEGGAVPQTQTQGGISPRDPLRGFRDLGLLPPNLSGMDKERLLFTTS